MNLNLLNMLVKYFSTIRNYVLSISSQRKNTIYYKNTNSRNVIGKNPWMVIPLLANQDLTPMLGLSVVELEGGISVSVVLERKES